MASTSYFLILCFTLAEHTFADPDANTVMGKAFVFASPAARPMRPGTTKLGAQPLGKHPATSRGAEPPTALSNPGILKNMEREIARLEDENFMSKMELQQLRSQIEKMDVFQSRTQDGPDTVKSSLLADLRLWASLAGVVVGAILYSIIGKLHDRRDGVAAMSASFLDGAELQLANAGGVALGGWSGIPKMKATGATPAGFNKMEYGSNIAHFTSARTEGVQVRATARSAVVQMQQDRPPFSLKLDLGRRGKANLKFKPNLEASEAVVVEYPLPFALNVEPQGQQAVCTKAGEGGELEGDVLRYCTAFKMGVPKGDGLGSSIATIGGKVEWQLSLFDVAKATNWQSVVDALVSNKPERTDKVVLIFERPTK